MARADLIVAGKRVVIPDGIAPAAIVIRDGTITAVADYGAAPDAARRVDVGDADALAAKARAAARCAMVDYDFWGGVVPGNLDRLGALADAGIRGFKCFLVPSGIDEFPPVAAADLRPAMARLAELGAVLLVHAELPGPIERAARSRPAAADGGRRYRDYLASRPPEAEGEAIAQMLALSRE